MNPLEAQQSLPISNRSLVSAFVLETASFNTSWIEPHLLQTMSTTVRGTDPSLTYSPPSAWTPGQDGTIMFATAAGVTAELSFTGMF